jgi:membrane-associated protein
VEQVGSGRGGRDTPGPWLWLGGAVALLLLGVLQAAAFNASERLGVLASRDDEYAYLVVALLVFADGVCAIFPGETTLSTASTLAANGKLSLSLVMLAGAVGAVTGDTALYWLARAGGSRFQARVDRATRGPRVAMMMDLIGARPSVLLCFGRYVPGLRFVVNATCGLTRLPYRHFILWSAVGGTLWSVVTCTIAYSVSTALSEYPLASIVISGLVSTVAIGVIVVVLRRQRRGAAVHQGIASRS